MTNPEPILLDITVRPHRSLSPQARRGLILGLAGLAGALAVGFWRLGAWPVVGLMGADIALLVWALRYNQRDGDRCERIHLTPSCLRIHRIDARGVGQEEQWQPYWLQVELEPRADGAGALRLISHGRSVTLGAFLSPGERIALAEQLQQGLALARQPHNPSTSRME